MNKKLLFMYVISLLFISNIVKSQIELTNLPYDGISPGELLIINNTSYWRQFHNGPHAFKILVKIIPAGAFFTAGSKYSPKGQITVNPPYFDNITGGVFLLDTITNLNATPPRRKTIVINFDIEEPGTEMADLNIGLGLYRIEFWAIPDGEESWLSNYVYIDWRNEKFIGNQLPNYGNNLDIRIDYFKTDTITFRHYPYTPLPGDSIQYFYHINYVNKYIKMWEIIGSNYPFYPYSKGLFSSDSSNNGAYLKWPINANQFNGDIGQENPGDLGMNLVINHNVTTRDTLLQNPTSILTPVNGFLKIANGKTFEMISAVNGYNILVVQDSSTLTLEANSSLIVNATNRLLLKKTGTISLGYNSEILFKDGFSFCNQGGLITSPQGGTGMIPERLQLTQVIIR